MIIVEGHASASRTKCIYTRVVCFRLKSDFVSSAFCLPISLPVSTALLFRHQSPVALRVFVVFSSFVVNSRAIVYIAGCSLTLNKSLAWRHRCIVWELGDQASIP